MTQSYEMLTAQLEEARGIGAMWVRQARIRRYPPSVALARFSAGVWLARVIELTAKQDAYTPSYWSQIAAERDPELDLFEPDEAVV